MDALIIGGAGFVGSYLIEHLTNELHWSVAVTKTAHSDLRNSNPNVTVLNLDILNKSDVSAILYEIRPKYIFHLAAQSSVQIAWKNPTATVNVNIIGTINVLDAVRELFYKPRILLVGSGEEYGHINVNEIPIKEDTLTRPGNIYAATKACQNMIGKIYSDAYDMDIVMVRAFNHIGPTQTPLFVVSDFCKQVAEIEKGLRKPLIDVGNLSAERDFTDVRDVVRAYAMLVEKGKTGETYNVGSGIPTRISHILDTILSLSDVKIFVNVDQGKVRPVDVPIIVADTEKIFNTTGWKPAITLENTIIDTLNYWRNHIDINWEE